MLQSMICFFIFYLLIFQSKNANFTFHYDTKSYKNSTFTGSASTLNEFNKYNLVVITSCVFVCKFAHFIKKKHLKKINDQRKFDKFVKKMLKIYFVPGHNKQG